MPFLRCDAYWRDARVAEEARLESVYTSKAYPGFESPSLRLKSSNENIREFVSFAEAYLPLQ